MLHTRHDQSCTLQTLVDLVWEGCDPVGRLGIDGAARALCGDQRLDPHLERLGGLDAHLAQANGVALLAGIDEEDAFGAVLVS
ncbi:MAG: hypothetical protein ACF8MF_10045 [Phycisphaerales bacterium JB052]